MTEEHPKQDDLYAGLRILLEAAFPKRCRTCGREYANAAEFIAATQPVRRDHTGLKQSLDDDGKRIVELFRNCACGSTLLESFFDRRGLSDADTERRQHFEGLLKKLVEAGVEAGFARIELRKLMRNQPNEVVAIIRSIEGE